MSIKPISAQQDTSLETKMLGFEEFTALRRRQEAAVEAELRARAAVKGAYQHSSSDEEDEEDMDEHGHHHHSHSHPHRHSDDESDLSDTDPLELLMKAKKAGYLPSAAPVPTAPAGAPMGEAGHKPRISTSPNKPAAAASPAKVVEGAESSVSLAPEPAGAIHPPAAAAPAVADANTSPPHKGVSEEGSSGALFLRRVACGVESWEVQALMLALLFLDLLATMALCVADQGKDPWADAMEGSLTMALRHNVLQLIESFSALVLLVSVLEMTLLFLAFKSGLGSHLGYLSDLVLLAVLLYSQLLHVQQPREVRLLSVCRVWRAFRLVSTLLESAKDKHTNTQQQLQQEQAVSEELRVEVRRLEDAVRREREGKRRLNDMLQGYKDEVETLNEALKIAALDVALVAEESDGSEDEEEAVMMEAMRSREHRPPNTIFVNEDGTFEIK